MTAYDPDLSGQDLDSDLLDFDARDAIEASRLDRFSAAMTGYAERPGVHRRIGDPFASDPALSMALDAHDDALAAEFGLSSALLTEAS